MLVLLLSNMEILRKGFLIMRPSTTYSYIFDDSSPWSFIIPLNANELTNSSTWLETQEKLINFHHDYLLLSQRYKLGELYGQEYLKELKLDFKNDYIEFLKQYFTQHEYLTFFPRNTKKLNLPCLFSSELSYHNSQGEAVKNYIYDLHGFKKLEEIRHQTEECSEAVLAIETNGFFRKNDFSWEEDEYPIYFHLGIQTDLFYPQLKFGFMKDPTIKSDQTFDNTELAYQNASRFNSYLKALKALITKYGWVWEFDDDEPNHYREFLTKDGILLDGKLVYYEDVREISKSIT